ncbi:MAG: hypothetical protein BWX98_02663 [Candidatus Aminicenantes bacterium ADurb.Bin147]|nr:MAG: hypothetical protein BWX98_02663 [Candidatus Aminicenantes bacterium ADurb.Bin147]
MNARSRPGSTPWRPTASSSKTPIPPRPGRCRPTSPCSPASIASGIASTPSKTGWIPRPSPWPSGFGPGATRPGRSPAAASSARSTDSPRASTSIISTRPTSWTRVKRPRPEMTRPGGSKKTPTGRSFSSFTPTRSIPPTKARCRTGRCSSARTPAGAGSTSTRWSGGGRAFTRSSARPIATT